MKFLKYSRIILSVSAGLAAMCMEPIQASAEESIMPSAGITLMLEAQASPEDYEELARQVEGASWGYTNIGIANVENGNLNVRKEPSIDGKLVGKMPKDSACEVLETVDGWAHITSGEVEGYVSLDYLLTGLDAKLKASELVNTIVVANVDGLNVRDEPNTESAVLTKVLKGEELEYIETLDGWIHVSIDDEDAYVAAEYVTVEDRLGTAVTMTELRYGVGVSDVRVEIVEYAKQFLGNKYVYGGTSLTKGTDCSGFVQSVFKKFGVKLSRTSQAQSGNGKKIKASDLQPGDLVFYANSSGTVNHVALYIGGGKVIHASSPKSGIKISKYNYRTPVKYRNVLGD